MPQLIYQLFNSWFSIGYTDEEPFGVLDGHFVRTLPDRDKNDIWVARVRSQKGFWCHGGGGDLTRWIICEATDLGDVGVVQLCFPIAPFFLFYFSHFRHSKMRGGGGASYPRKNSPAEKCQMIPLKLTRETSSLRDVGRKNSRLLFVESNYFFLSVTSWRS